MVMPINGQEKRKENQVPATGLETIAFRHIIVGVSFTLSGVQSGWNISHQVAVLRSLRPPAGVDVDRLVEDRLLRTSI